MAEIEIRWATLQAQIRWILGTSLCGVVVQLDAIKRVAEGIKTVKHHAARQSHLGRRLQTVVRSGLIGLSEQNRTKRASGRGAGGYACIVDWPARGDVSRGAGRADGCKSAGGGRIDIL